MSSVQEVSDAVAALLEAAGSSPPFTLDAIPGGANNRVFRVEAHGRSYFLKSYRRHPDDPHDRLGHDWSFSRFAWEHGIQAVARPLACDKEHALGLFEFQTGRRIAPYDIDHGHLQQAARFFHAINSHRSSADAAQLPLGYEATFRVSELLARVEERVETLGKIDTTSPACERARDFVRTRLASSWESVREAVAALCRSAEVADELPADQRALSPVDFGFHNVLVDPSGGCVFHDFEYAGWDDPARMLCDFFCQMQLPAPREYAEEFAKSALADFPRHEELLHRAERLWPVFRIAWCCTVLTDFLPVALTRPRYAGQPPSELRRTRQLEMAELLLSRRLDDCPWTTGTTRS